MRKFIIILKILWLLRYLLAQKVSSINGKSPLKNPNQIPPNIYQWIEENAHICTDVRLNKRIKFLSATEGANCLMCVEPLPGEVPHVACAAESQDANSVELDIGCYPLPELCVIELRERYTDFFAEGGRIPKMPRGGVAVDNDTISSITVDPFVESNIVAEEFYSTKTIFGLQQITIIADQSTPDAGSAPILSQKRSSSLRRVDNKNENDREQKMKAHAVETTTIDGSCQDKHELCCFWASAGECDKNPFWMRINCAKTCGTCNCKVQNANLCESTGVECQMIIMSSSTTTLQTLSHSTSLPFISPSPDEEISSSTFKSRFRMRPSGGRTRGRQRRPQLSVSLGDHGAPGHRPQRPFLRKFTSRTSPEFSNSHFFSSTSTTVKDSDSDYRDPDTLKIDLEVVNYDNDANNDYGLNIDNNADNKNNGDGSSNPIASNDYGGSIGDDKSDKTSKSLSSSAITKLPNFIPPRETCFNYNRLCRFWAELGECDRNPFWMRPHCQKACDSCNERFNEILTSLQRHDCENMNKLCPFWAFIGECARNTRWMSSNCRASCHHC